MGRICRSCFMTLVPQARVCLKSLPDFHTDQLGFPILWSGRRTSCVLWWWHLQGCSVSLGLPNLAGLSLPSVLWVSIILGLFWKLFDVPESPVFGDDKTCFIHGCTCRVCESVLASVSPLSALFALCVLLNSSIKCPCVGFTFFPFKSPWCYLDKLKDVALVGLSLVWFVLRFFPNLPWKLADNDSSETLGRSFVRMALSFTFLLCKL